uniref:Uncharacterized protein n=1 Tax=viral metagenome TaxID=1070528 RepID=A0A6M3JDU6_9ZZZZ
MATKDSQEQQEKDFINEFIRIAGEGILRDYEKKNRDRIGEASLIVKDAFDKQWIKVTGNSYYQPVTTVAPPTAAFGRNNTERSDPRSRKYRANVVFSEIQWQKIRRKIGKRIKDLYNLKGKVKETGAVRPIFQNLTIDRLKEIFGEQDTEKILVAGKANDHGEIKGSFDLKVEGYWEVIFAPAGNLNDPVDVQLMWEGQCLIMKRMAEVVLPGFYLEVADNATQDNFIQTPKDGRKKIGVIQKYPYTVLREATLEEFLAQKASGDRIMRDKRAKDEG